MMTCQCVARYKSPEQFQSPDKIWETKEGHSLRSLNGLFSISYFALSVIANSHNHVMASKTASRFSKAVAVVALSAVTLTVPFLAVAEAVARFVTAPFITVLSGIATCSPFMMIPVGTYTLGSSFYAVTQIPNAMITLYDVNTAIENIRVADGLDEMKPRICR